MDCGCGMADPLEGGGVDDPKPDGSEGPPWFPKGGLRPKTPLCGTGEEPINGGETGRASLKLLSCGGNGPDRLCDAVNIESCSGNGALLGGASPPPEVSWFFLSPYFSPHTSPNGSGPASGPVCFSKRSKSCLVRPGFNKSPVVSPNISLLTPTPLDIQAGRVSRSAPL